MNDNNRINFNPLQPSPFQMKFEKTLLKAVRKHKIAIDKLTEKQVVDVFKQVILSGDIQKHVAGTSNGTHTQGVTYVPYSHEQVLKHRIEVLEAELARHGIPMP